MDDLSKLEPSVLIGDADPVPSALLVSYPEQAETLTLLYQVTRELTSILDREELLRRIAQHVKRLVNYHVFTVMLWNEQRQLLEGVFAMHYENSIPAPFRVPLHQGITGIAAGERRTLRVSDVKKDPRYIQCGTEAEVRSELVVPLLLQDRLIGVLDLESTVTHAFTSDHESLLATLASYIAIALENARLYQEARENERRLQSELETAREIQRQLLPTGARDVPGLDLAAVYVPAQELGGDFYDFLLYSEGKLALALGDVSGKGTAAALYGSLAIGTLRELVVDHASDPAQMLALLNHRLHGARLESRFIAMLFAVYDAAARRVTLSNAGSPYPFLVRNAVAQEISIAGVPLGLISGTQYEEINVDLQPGDVVLFASDGILECENADEEQFGSKRLAALLANVAAEESAQAIADRVLRATDEHSGAGVAQHDDRTLLVLRVTDASPLDFSKLPCIY